MATYIFKTEPSTYSFDDLVRDGRTTWDGISNPVALRHLRGVKQGDDVLVYHTSDVKAVVGRARAAGDGRPDPKDPTGRLVVVDLVAGDALPVRVTLAQVKADPVLSGCDLARLPRLSVIPLTPAQAKRLLELAGD